MGVESDGESADESECEGVEAAAKRERACEKKKSARKEEKIEENLQCRIAAYSRASILSFGPVHRNLHGKLPREERARKETKAT